MTTIVVPLDGSDFSEQAVPVASALAARRHGRVHLIRVAEPEASAGLDVAMAEAADRETGAPVTWEVVERIHPEQVAEAIDRTVQGIDDAVLCMTAHGRSGLGAALLGSTTEAVLRRIGRPVLVVGPKCESDWIDGGRLVIPLDGSPRAERILPYAASVSRTWHLEPWLVQVAHPFDNEVAQTAANALDRPARLLRGHGLDVKTAFQWSSAPAACIAAEARSLQAGLILMSSYIPTGAARTLIGSVTMGVIHRAPCPVLVCPPEAVAGGVNDPLETCVSGQ